MLENFFYINDILVDLSNFVYHISWSYLICTLLLFINMFMFFNAETIILKITWFFTITVICVSILWWATLETVGFILILTELTLLFFFLIVATQLTFKKIQNTKLSNNISILFVLLLFLLTSEHNFNVTSTSYYNSIYLITTADYFFLYYFLITYLDIVIYTALILGLFSIYFILLFYQLKQLLNNSKTKNKSIYFLRKQNLLHQALYQNYLRWFQ